MKIRLVDCATHYFAHLYMLIRRWRPAAAPTTGIEPDGEGVGAPTVLDEASLEKLRELDPTGKNHLIARVVKAFDDSAARLLPQLSSAFQASDFRGVRHVAHTLKSSSASIGALKLSEICAEIESMVRLGDPQGLGERLEGPVAAMKREVAKVQAALRLLAGPAP